MALADNSSFEQILAAKCGDISIDNFSSHAMNAAETLRQQSEGADYVLWLQNRPRHFHSKAQLKQKYSRASVDNVRSNSTDGARPASPSPGAPSAPEFTTTIEALSPAARESLAALVKSGASYPKHALSEKRLKHEWRKLARIYHPDLNPRHNSQLFIDILRHHQILLKSFQELAMNAATTHESHQKPAI